MNDSSAEFYRSVLVSSRVDMVDARGTRHPGLAYRIWTGERRVSLYAQQIRAINLADAICELLPFSVEGQKIAVIGGGISGFTFAVRLLNRSPSVTAVHVFEKSAEKSDGLGPNVRGSDRWIWPRLLDWPKLEFTAQDAGLPVLNWSAGNADTVRKQIAKGVAEAFQTFQGKLKRVDGQGLTRSSLALEKNQLNLSGNCFSVVIDATGLGAEQQIPCYNIERPLTSYWDHQIPRDDKLDGQLVIVGSGDGALIELLCAMTKHTVDTNGGAEALSRDSLEWRIRDPLLQVAKNEAAVKSLNQVESRFQLGLLKPADALFDMKCHARDYAGDLVAFFRDNSRELARKIVAVSGPEALFDPGASLVWRYCLAAFNESKASKASKDSSGYQLQSGRRATAVVCSNNKFTVYCGAPSDSNVDPVVGTKVLLRLGPRVAADTAFEPPTTATAPSFASLPRRAWSFDDLFVEYDSAESYLSDLEELMRNATKVDVLLDRISPSGQLHRATQANAWFQEIVARNHDLRIASYDGVDRSTRNVLGVGELLLRGIPATSIKLVQERSTLRYHLVTAGEQKVAIVSIAKPTTNPDVHLRSSRWFRSSDPSLFAILSADFESRWRDGVFDSATASIFKTLIFKTLNELETWIGKNDLKEDADEPIPQTERRQARILDEFKKLLPYLGKE